jgi:hypothetical protein
MLRVTMSLQRLGTINILCSIRKEWMKKLIPKIMGRFLKLVRIYLQ